MRLLCVGLDNDSSLETTSHQKCTHTHTKPLLLWSVQNDRRRAKHETAAKERDLEERRKDIEALTDKVNTASCIRQRTKSQRSTVLGKHETRNMPSMHEIVVQ